MKITQASSISYQNSFQNTPFPDRLKKISTDDELISPNYEEIINPNAIRRMSKVTLMATAAAIKCLSNLNTPPQGIIVGSAHGCPLNTRKFLESIQEKKGRLLSPTPFMLSTHNTIAGQISLITCNNGYNITHTQNSLSFEHALIDAQLHFKEGASCLLVGSSDELETKIYKHKLRLNNPSLLVGEGASFFVLENSEASQPEIIDVTAITFVNKIEETLISFLAKNKTTINELGAVYFSCSSEKNQSIIDNLFVDSVKYDIHDYCKSYMTNSSFGLHLACEHLKIQKHQYALVFNNLINENLGLTLLKYVQ